MAHTIATLVPTASVLRTRAATRTGLSGSLRSPCAPSNAIAARVTFRGASINGMSARVRTGTARRMTLFVKAEDGDEEMMIEEESLERMQKSISVLNDNLSTVRTGRANPAVLDRLVVEYYGAPCDLKSLATVNTPDAQSLLIQPFDKTSIQAIEKAIMTSDLGLNPSNDGNVIRLGVPPLTQERRQELAKLVSKLGEDSKVALRNVRRDATKQLQKLEKEGSSSKDTIADYCKSVDDMTAKYVKEIDEVTTKKEKEIMTV